MARDLTTNFVTAIESDVIRPFFAAKFEFATVTVRAWTGYGNITINSEVYKGVGTFGQINTVAETTETKAVSQDFILSGIPKENLSLDHFEISIDDMTSISNIAVDEQKCLAWSGDFDPLEVD